jgi:hypothetical protein
MARRSCLKDDEEVRSKEKIENCDAYFASCCMLSSSEVRYL